MAQNTPENAGNPERPGGTPGKKRSWLSTNDWLEDKHEKTPPPKEPGSDSAIRKPRPSDSEILAQSELAELQSQLGDDEEIDLATPPDGAAVGPPSLSKILKATGTKSDILRAGDSGSGRYSKSGRRESDQPPGTEESSDIFSSARDDSNILRPSASGGQSDLLSGGQSDLFGGIPAGDRGSSLHDDLSSRTDPDVPRVSEQSNVFTAAELDDAASDDPSAVRLDEEPSLLSSHFGPPSSARMADRLLAELTGDKSADAGSQDDVHSIDFNALDRSAVGSNLFDDVTAMDINLEADAALSGIMLDQPNQPGRPDAGPSSSIFQKPSEINESSHAVIDLSHIPLMGSTDDPADQVNNLDWSGPASSVLKEQIDKELAQSRAHPEAISFDLPENADAPWRTLAARREQQSMGMPISDDELDLAAQAASAGTASSKKKKKETDSVFDDSFDLPDESGVLYREPAPSGASSILHGVNREELAHAANLDAAIASTRPAPSTRTARPPVRAPDGLNWMSVAACLLLGTFAGAGGMYLAIPKDLNKPTAVAARDLKQISTLDAARLLAAGDPDAALRALTDNPDESLEVKAIRGQARWLARLRDAATNNTKLQADDREVQLAQADLRSIIDSIGQMTTPKQQQAAAQAALHLGLIDEALGRPADAVKLYKSMATQLPAYQRVFETAANRTSIMRTRPDGTAIPDNQYSHAAHDLLSPQDLWQLADANRVLFQFDPVQQLDDEPGFAFWEAVQLAVMPGKLQQATAAIQRARRSHDVRRRLHAGMGLNPFTDPSEQMFLRACDELMEYWKLKLALYNAAGATASQKPLPAVLDDLVAAKQAASQAEERVALANAEIKLAVTNAQQYQQASKQAETALAEARKELAALQQLNAERQTSLERTEQAVTELKRKLKTVDDSLDPLIRQLKDWKLIEAAASRDQAIAALPEAVRQAAAMGDGTGRAAALAKELADFKQRSEADLAAAAKKLEAAAAQAATERAKLEHELRAARAQADDAAARIQQAQAELERKLREQAEAFQRQLAAVRAGMAVTLSSTEQDYRELALREYGLGLDAYFAARYADAETHFRQASERDPGDARFWYFLGLARLVQGNDAEPEFRRGAQQEALGLPRRSVIDGDLLRVQGSLRSRLERLRP